MTKTKQQIKLNCSKTKNCTDDKHKRNTVKKNEMSDTTYQCQTSQ